MQRSDHGIRAAPELSDLARKMEEKFVHSPVPLSDVRRCIVAGIGRKP